MLIFDIFLSCELVKGSSAVKNQNFLSKNTLTLAVVLALGSFLTACGGGGSDNSTTANTPHTVTPQPVEPKMPAQPISPVVNTPTPPTTNNSGVVINSNQDQAEKVALDLLNDHRQKCGFGKLTINQQLNNTATNHAKYLTYASETNKFTLASHDERLEKFNGQTLINTGENSPYYSGLSVKERLNPTTKGKDAIATIYPYQGFAENIGFSYVDTSNKSYQSDTVKKSQEMLQGLLTAPYHMRSLLSPKFTDIGISYQEATWATSKTNQIIISVLEMVSGLPEGQAITKNSQVLHYPCNDVVTDYQLTHESPNPFGTTRDLEKEPIGQPIYILAPENVKITHASAEISGVATLHQINNGNDINKLLSANEVIFMPDTPLKANMTYQVAYKLTYDNGEQVSNSFSFKTKE